ncbi:MAG: hypothetical protein RBR22_07150 [Desulfuromonas sp.]|nr:hypothetical protein [Desulfuromonas sp.]
MKTTTLVLAALIISISSGTALANSRNHQQETVITKHTKIVKQQPQKWQARDYKSQAQHSQIYTKTTIRHENQRTRVAKIDHTKQLRQQPLQKNSHLAEQVQRYNQQRHEQMRTHSVKLNLPMPRIALVFPW